MCIAHTLYELPTGAGQLYLHCSLIYFWVPSSCFCIVISLSLRWNNPVQRCLPVGRLSTPEAVASRIDWSQTALRNHQQTTSGIIIITQSIIFSFSTLTPSCILHRAQQTSRWRICMSVIAAFASFSSLVFCRAGLCRYGVITVMINSPWQARRWCR